MGAGWSPQRTARVEEIIILHMRDDVAPDDDPESHLLQVATSWDVSGRRRQPDRRQSPRRRFHRPWPSNR
ncbi:hypothetical protein MXD61_12790 [Frankia sp. AgPm24]|nr:hypothetical protein [Frankia sp. AgPm24]MCK9922734.1 hypothetical protein [Frankia sp. AgPm24]